MGLSRHVAKRPVMLLRPVARRQHESNIAVVAGLIDLVHKRRPLLRTPRLLAMTGGAVLAEQLLPIVSLKSNRWR